MPHSAVASDADPVLQGAEIIVRYAPGTDSDQRVDAREGADVSFRDTLLLPRTQVVNPDPDQSLKGAINDLESDPNVLYAEPNYVQQLQDVPPQVAPPNDGYFGNQWGLYNFGQTLTRGVTNFPGTFGADTDARAGWYIQKTSPDVVTAVIDSGIDTDNPDLINQIWTNTGETPGNGIDDDHNGFIDDVHGWDFLGTEFPNGDNDPEDGLDHGTHVAGTIGATGNNSFGGAGVSWNAKIMPLRVCPATGGCSVSAMVNAITYASHMGATVANISIGGHSFSQTQRDALRNASNVLFTIAAGNNANDGDYPYGDNEIAPTYPCQSDQLPANQPALGNIICVGASDQNDGWADFSNFGPTSVDLAAPGKNILSTLPNWADVRPVDSFETVAGWNLATAASPTNTQWEQGPIGLGSPQTGGITDSYAADYPASIDSIATNATPINLAGKSGCSAEYFFKSHTEDSGAAATSDWFYFEAAHDPSGPWTIMDGWKGEHTGSIVPAYLYSRNDGSGDLGKFEGDSSVYFRFRLHPDGDANVDSGAYVDNFKVRCAAAGGTVGYLDGTSMAAPHVAGLASLVRQAAPKLTIPEVKTAILNGVDPDPAFATAGPHPTVTGGRESIYNTLASLDLTPPDAPELQSPPNGANIWGDQTFSWSVSDVNATYQLVIDNGAPVLGGPGLSKGSFAIPLGHHKWFVQATDESGNTTQSKTRSFTYTKNPKISIKSVKVRHGRKGGAVVRVKLPARGSVKVIASKTKSGRNVLARGSSKTPSARTVLVVLHLTKKGKAALRGKGAVKTFIGAVYVAPGDRKHRGIARRSGKIGAPGR